MFSIISDLLEKIFKEVKSNSSNTQLKVNCPKCARTFNDYTSDGKFNLEISLDKKIYHCWKCGIKGRLKNLFKYYGNNEIYNFYLDNFEFELYSDTTNENDYSFELFEIHLPVEFISFADYNEYDEKFVEPYNYLTQTRKLDLQTLVKYNIGFCLKGKYRKRIIIPSYDINNNINYFISRTYIEDKVTYLNPDLNRDLIINEHLIDWNCTIYIVEGIFDYLSIPINTLVLNGKGINNIILSKLKKYKPSVTLLIDGDAIKDTINIIDILENNGINNINYVYLDKKYDIDKIRRDFGFEYLKKYIKENTKKLNESDRILLC